MGAGRRTTIHVSGQGAALQPGPVGGGRAGVGEDSSRLEASLSLRAKVYRSRRLATPGAPTGGHPESPTPKGDTPVGSISEMPPGLG